MYFIPLQFQPIRAWRAARVIADDPENLAQVFTVIESLSFDTIHRLYKRLVRSEAGRALLEQRPNLVDKLADREALARLPDGSLGRAYLAFVERENISAEGIRAASVEGAPGAAKLPPPLDYVHARMRDTHDLWHVVTGMAGDIVGEVALLSFTLAQTRNPAIGLIVGIGLLKTAPWPEARPVFWQMFQLGRRAAWLPEQAWETLLDQPLEEVRRVLGIKPVGHYRQLRAAEVAAASA